MVSKKHECISCGACCRISGEVDFSDSVPKLAKRLGLQADDPAALVSASLQREILERIAKQLHDFPGYAQVRAAAISVDPWEVGNGLHTPTLKLRRNKIMEYFREEIEKLYAGH